MYVMQFNRHHVKFPMPFLILTVLYYGTCISNGHTKYEFQILSYTRDIALRILLCVNKARALFILTQLK
jgi:hypothetical protein